jgi:hypothetical protein
MYTGVLSYLHMLTTTQYMLLQRIQVFFWDSQDRSSPFRRLTENCVARIGWYWWRPSIPARSMAADPQPTG